MRKLSLRFVTLILTLSAALMADGAPVHARRSTASILQMLDANKDSTADETEARQAASALFDRLDTDKDGTLDANELRGRLSDFGGGI
jgi:hypothetical protein